jgi:hypothetical protein
MLDMSAEILQKRRSALDCLGKARKSLETLKDLAIAASGVCQVHELYKCMTAEHEPDRLILSPEPFSNRLMLFIRYVAIRIF